MKFIEKYKTNKYSPGLNEMSYLVLHHTASPATQKWLDVVKYLATSTAQVSVHYVVDRNWDVYKLCDDNRIAWHAWVSERLWKKNINDYSIWIEIVSDGNIYTDEQRLATRELVKYLINAHNIPTNWIIRHKDIAPKRKIDVGDNFWNNEYKSFKLYQNSFMVDKIDIAEEAKKLWIRNWEEWERAATRKEVATMLYKLYQLVKK